MAKHSDSAKVAGNPDVHEAVAEAVELYLANWKAFYGETKPLPTVSVVVTVYNDDAFDGEEGPSEGVQSCMLDPEDYLP